MIEKRSIGEIIKSILLLVNEAKQKNEQIKNISKPKTLLTDNKIIFKTLKKNTSEARKDISDWRNIQFTQKSKRSSTFDIEETLINEIRIKCELKLKTEIGKWSKNKIPKILDKHLRDHTRGLLKK